MSNARNLANFKPSATGQVETGDIADAAVTSAKLDTNIAVTGNFTADSTTLVVDSANNRVGIGTASPTYLLEARGSTDVISRFRDSTNGIIDIKTTGSTNADPMQIDVSNRSLTLAVNATERLRIDTSGNVGIGTSSPTQKLSIAAGSGAGASIEMAGNGNTLGTTSFFVGQGTAGVASVYQRNATQPLTFGTANTERMRIDSSGRVGIGTTSPDVALEIQPVTAYTTAYAADLGVNAAALGYGSSLTVWDPSNSATVSGLSLFTRSTGLSRWDILNVWTSTYTGDLVFRGRSGGTSTIEAMRITSSGNVGIGTSSPAYDGFAKTVSVLSSTQATLELATSRTTTGTYIGGVSYVQTNNTSASQYRVASVEGYNIGSTANNTGGYLTFNTKADGTAAIAERMRIDSDGALVLSTSFGGTKILSGSGISFNKSQTSAEGNMPYIAASSNASLTNLHIASTSTSGGIVFFTGSAVAERLRITPSGNVGIGTSSAAYRLNVVGTSTVSVFESTSGPVYLRLSAPSASSGYIGYGDGTAENMTFWTTNVERFRIGSAGQLGIGGANYGTSGQVLTSQGSGAAPVWSDPGGGAILQVVSSTKTDTQGMTSTTYTDITGLSVSITPTSTSSKILILATVNGAARNGWNNMGLGLFRGATQIYRGDAAGSRSREASVINGSANDGTQWAVSMNFLDSPSTTSATTYKIMFHVMQDNPSSGIYINRTYNDTDSGGVGRVASTITVMEIAG